MDALTYFLLNYGLYSLLLVVPAAGLGAILGWLAWGKHRAGAEEARTRMEEAERAVAEVELTLSKEREEFQLYRAAVESEGGAPVASPALTWELAELRRAAERAEESIAAAVQEKHDAEKRLAAAREDVAKLESELASVSAPPAKGKLMAKGEGKEPEPEEPATLKGAGPVALPKSELKKLKAERRQLEKRLAALEKSSAKRVAELEKKLAAGEGALTRKVAEAEKLQAERGALDSELKATRAKLEGELKETRARLEKELKETRKRLEGELKTAQAELEEREKSMQVKLEEKRKSAEHVLEAERQAARIKLEDERKMALAAQETAKKVRDELEERTAKEIEDLKVAQAELQESLRAVEKDRDGKDRDLATVRNEKDELSAKLNAEQELRGAEREQAGKELETLRSRQGELEVQADSLAKQQEQTAADLEKVSAERAELEHKLSEAQSSAAVAEARLAEISGDKKGLEGDLAATREEREEFKAGLEAIRGERAGLEAKVTELEAGIAKAGQDLDELTAARAELEEHLAEAQRKAAMVQVDLELLRQQREGELKALEEHRAAEARWADELHRLREEKKELHRNIAMLAGESKAEVLINQIKAEKERLRHELADQQNERRQVEDAAGVLRRELHGLRHELVAAEARAEGLTEARELLKSAEERLTRTQADLSRALDERRRLQVRTGELEDLLAVAEETERVRAEEIAALRSTPAEPGAAAPEGGGGLGRRAASAAAEDLRASLSAVFGEDSEAGEDDDGDPEPAGTEDREPDLQEDARHGMVYRERPGEYDDLTQLRGVGEVIERRLNRAGIYMYRQIANWQFSQIRAISEDLKLRDRVKRDAWQKQARVLHKEKYGEKP